MIAQYSLTAGLAAIAAIAFMQIKKAILICSSIMIAALFGIYLVWVPEQATVIAQHVGIGRGTDLVLYIWILISFFSLVVVYLKMNNQFEAITSLARALALIRAEHQHPSDEKSGPTVRKTSPKKK
jgi:small membrane protein